MAMEAIMIGNPNSGSAGDEGYLERFAETLRTGGLEVEVLNTERPDHATELEAVREGSNTGEPPQHQAAHDRVDHGLARLAQPLVILAHPPALGEPADGSFGHPASR